MVMKHVVCTEIVKNMIGNETDEIIKEFFDSLLQKYEKW